MILTAHVIWAGAGDFTNGAAHVLVTVPHLAAICAGAICAGRSGEKEARWLLCGAATAAAAATVIPWSAGDLTLWCLAGGTAVFAMTGAAGRSIPVWLAWFCGGWTAWWILIDSRKEIDGLSFLSGVAAGTILLCLLAAGLARAAERSSPAGRFAIRVLASWISAAALLYLFVRTA